MALIDHIIPQSRLEVIPAAIYSILNSEFENQVYQFNNTNCSGVRFFSERSVPLDKTESVAIVIQSFKGDYEGKDQISTHARPYIYVIDVMTNAKSTQSKAGYQSSHERLLNVVAMIRYILEHPNYNTLSGVYGIEHTEVKGFQVYKDEKSGDDSDTAMGQIMFYVYCEESETANSFPYIAGSDTAVYLELTAQGYQYGAEFSPPLDPHYVYIVNQDGDLITQVAGGNTYTVTQLTNILQNLGTPVTTIVQEIPE